MKFFYSLSSFLIFKQTQATDIKTQFLLDRISDTINSDFNLSKLKNYGCYCFKSDQAFFTGRGPGLNQLDKLCKQLTNCYKCHQLYASDNCDATNYHKLAKTKSNSLVCPFENSDYAEDVCDSGFCQCDQFFIEAVGKLDLEGAVDEQFLDGNFDRESMCQKVDHSTKPIESATSRFAATQAQATGAAAIESILKPHFLARPLVSQYNLGNSQGPSFKTGSGTKINPNLLQGLMEQSQQAASNENSSDSAVQQPTINQQHNSFASLLGSRLENAIDKFAQNLGQGGDPYSDNTETEDSEDYLYRDDEMSSLDIIKQIFSAASQEEQKARTSKILKIIHVPIENIDHCCGDLPEWQPVVSATNSECCGHKSFNPFLSQCCNEKTGLLKDHGASC